MSSSFFVSRTAGTRREHLRADPGRRGSRVNVAQCGAPQVAGRRATRRKGTSPSPPRSLSDRQQRRLSQTANSRPLPYDERGSRTAGRRHARGPSHRTRSLLGSRCPWAVGCKGSPALKLFAVAAADQHVDMFDPHASPEMAMWACGSSSSSNSTHHHAVDWLLSWR
ncbi:hypothetical protein BU16DRAFT_542000 [Lophium mytilinum]|uniref:Uncharacterized protein n=1 Tax=Lophium mytilinum TaxID=390894 RepID=A0A6A6QK65_9PEZI|nr:hypothetical protein BU16DRAFT_542000 [Lophium mytilinum]